MTHGTSVKEISIKKLSFDLFWFQNFKHCNVDRNFRFVTFAVRECQKKATRNLDEIMIRIGLEVNFMKIKTLSLLNKSTW